MLYRRARVPVRFLLPSVVLLALGLSALSAATTNVSVRDFFYNATNVVINAGDTVTWVNNGGNAHDVVEGLLTTPTGVPRLFDSPTFSSGGSFSWVFTNVGFHRYFCSPHISMFPQQTGTVTVLPPLPAQIGAYLSVPTNNARVTNAFSVQLVGNGAARSSKLARIEFFSGNTFLSSASTYPFTSFATNLPTGTNLLTAVAVDVDGLRGTSAPVTLIHTAVPRTNVIAMTASAFSPNNVTISAGSSVIWSNTQAIAHTATGDATSLEPLCGAGVNLVGASRCTNLFSTPGVYPFFCSIHPSMRGTVFVAQASSSPFVVLTRPAPGGTLATNAPIVLEANASDPDGIGRVQFFRAPNTLLGQVAEPPYTITASLPAGTSSFFARAIDGQGFGNLSPLVTATLINAGPLQLQGVTNLGGNLRFQLTTTPGLTYVTERSAALPSGFQPFQTNVAATSVILITDPLSGSPDAQFYYRAFIQQ